jgi:hypothetical protein
MLHNKLYVKQTIAIVQIIKVIIKIFVYLISIVKSNTVLILN